MWQIIQNWLAQWGMSGLPAEWTARLAALLAAFVICFVFYYVLKYAVLPLWRLALGHLAPSWREPLLESQLFGHLIFLPPLLLWYRLGPLAFAGREPIESMLTGASAIALIITGDKGLAAILGSQGGHRTGHLIEVRATFETFPIHQDREGNEAVRVLTHQYFNSIVPRNQRNARL